MGWRIEFPDVQGEEKSEISKRGLKRKEIGLGKYVRDMLK